MTVAPGAAVPAAVTGRVFIYTAFKLCVFEMFAQVNRVIVVWGDTPRRGMFAPHFARKSAMPNEPGDPAPAVRELLNRHPFGLTRHEIARFSGLETAQVAACLEDLRDTGAISAQAYVRGTLYTRLNPRKAATVALDRGN